MKALKLFRHIIISIALFLTIYGFTLLYDNPDPENCVCDQPACATVTCDYRDYGYGQFCQYKYYPGSGWAWLSGSPCPYYPI